MFAAWATAPRKIWRSSIPFLKYDKTAVLLSNCQSPIPAIVWKNYGPCVLNYVVQEAVAVKAWDMFATRAFTHQYFAHGYNILNFFSNVLMPAQHHRAGLCCQFCAGRADPSRLPHAVAPLHCMPRRMWTCNACTSPCCLIAASGPAPMRPPRPMTHHRGLPCDAWPGTRRRRPDPGALC